MPKEEYVERDEVLLGMLQSNSLKFHLNRIIRVLETDLGTEESRKDEALSLIRSLRRYGKEENEEVEEFCQHILNHD